MGAAAEEDVRSIEAENYGDDDELDADLEREFLQQQEAKSRFRGSKSEGNGSSYGRVSDADDDELNMRGLGTGRESDSECKADLLWLKSGPSLAALAKEFEDEREMQRLPELGRSFLGGCSLTPSSKQAPSGSPVRKRAAENKLTLFPEFDCLGEAVTSVEKASETELMRGLLFVCEERLDKEFPVQYSKKKEGAKWLGLALPSNSDKYTNSDKHTWSGDKQLSDSFFRLKKRCVSGSSSKVATSLERQYSTGSTATVESPHFVVQEKKRGNDRQRRAREAHSSGAPRLTFSFPGWGVDISKGERHPSVVNHHAESTLESFEPSTKRLRSSPDWYASAVSRGKGIDEDLGERSPVSEIPDEILLHVMRRLDTMDLISSVQTCKRWYTVGLHDDLWDHLLGNSDRGLLSDSSSDVLPRWVCKKNLCLSENVRLRFNVFCKGYDYLRHALHEWWDNGLQNSRHSSKVIYSLIRKLTVNDWSLLYEALGVAFTDRTDRIANTLLRKLKTSGRLTLDGKSSESTGDEKREYNVGTGILAPLYENSRSAYSLARSSTEFEVHWKSGSVKEVSQVEGVVGKELWESLLKSWDRYKSWLHLISTHCPDLNREVTVEKARSRNWTATPTLYNKGLICFRSQVVLRYGLRKVLQGGFMYLTTQEDRGDSSEHEMDLLRHSHHLLQELDVADDSTLPRTSRTQTKLRQCFRTALSRKFQTGFAYE